MKTFVSVLMTIPLLFSIGCESIPRGTQTEAVGPDPMLKAGGGTTGTLKVYSAFQFAPVNVDMDEAVSQTAFAPGNVGSTANAQLHTRAHSSYCIFTADKKFLKRVPNSTGLNDANPANETLPVGNYLIEADTEQLDGFVHPVLVPVRIKPGLTTVVHLDGQWNSTAPVTHTGLVTFPNGHGIGWQAIN